MSVRSFAAVVPCRAAPLPPADIHRAMAYRIVYADTDAMGVVYHGKYLEIAERSRAEMIARAGINLREIEKADGIILLVNRVRADYRTPVLLHQTASVTSSVLKAGASQVWWRSQIAVEGRLAANIDVATACFRKSAGETVTMPSRLASRIATLQQETAS